MRKFTLLALLSFVATYASFAQTTYTWKVSSGDWRTADSWNPSRTSPAANDILVFNGSTISTAIVDSIPRQIVGKLRIINNATVKFNSGLFFVCSGTISRSSSTVTGTGTAFLTETKVGEQIYEAPLSSPSRWGEIATITGNTTLTMTSGTKLSSDFGLAPSIIVSGGDSAFEVRNGSTLVLNSASPPVSIYVDAGSTGLVSGNISLQKGTCRVFAADSASMIFQNGATVRTDSSFGGNSFTAVGKQNTHVFQAGSTFEAVAGANPFGFASPVSKVIFNTGSNYVQLSTSGFSVTGRKFANLICRSTSALNASGGNGLTIDTLAVEVGTLNIAATGTANNIRGDIRVASGATLNFNSASPTINLNGTSPQKISGSGTITFSQPIVLNINNPNGIQLNRNFDIKNSSLILHSGNIDLNGNTFTIGSSAAATGSVELDSVGAFVGSGTVTRWFGTDELTLGQDASTFYIMDTSGHWQAVTLNGTPSNGGTVSVKFNNVAGTTPLTTFNDNATNNVSVNIRTNKNWIISTGNSFEGSDLSLAIASYSNSTQVTEAADLRITLASSIAPGTSGDGGHFDTDLPYAVRNGLSESDFNNTFYIGADSSQNPLPAELLYLKGQTINNKDAQIEWATASEVNVAYFAVLGSDDGVLFNETIATVYPEKNSKGVKTYSIKHTDAFAQVYTKYYRLYTKDMDGSYVYSEIIVLNNDQISTNNQQLSVFPNPLQNDVNVLFEKPMNGQINIRVIDMQGKEVYENSLEINNANKLSLPLNDLNAGIYFMQISGNDVYQILKIKKD